MFINTESYEVPLFDVMSARLSNLVMQAANQFVSVVRSREECKYHHHQRESQSVAMLGWTSTVVLVVGPGCGPVPRITPGGDL